VGVKAYPYYDAIGHSSVQLLLRADASARGGTVGEGHSRETEATFLRGDQHDIRPILKSQHTLYVGKIDDPEFVVDEKLRQG
jgi:hypothetical protein